MKKFLIVSLMLSIPAFLSASEEAKKLNTSPRKVNILRISSDKTRLHESPKEMLDKKASSPRDSSGNRIITTDNWGHFLPLYGPKRNKCDSIFPLDFER